MTKRILIFTAALAAGLAAAQAAVPYRVSFQGRLDDGGSPATGTRNFVFKIYDALTGGSLLWTSQTEAVNVANGVFSVVLETGTPANLSTATFSGARFIEITVDGTLLSPRETVVSAPYALVAQSLAAGAAVPLAALEKDPSALSTVNTATNPVDWSQLKNVPGSVLAAGGALTVNEGGVTILTPATTMDFDGNQFNITAAAPSAGVALAPSSVTLQGNVFNGNSQLVRLDTAGKLPALDGSALTALNAANLGSGTLPDGRLSGTYSAALTFGSAAGGPVTFSTNVVVAAAQVQVGSFASAPNPASPGAGSIFFNTGDSTLYVSNGGSWSPLASGGASPWTSSGGKTTLVSGTDLVGIGLTPSAEKLEVSGNIKASGVLIVGSGPNTITTAAGLLDASKLTNGVPTALVNLSTVTTALGNKLDSATGVLPLKQVTGVAASTDTVAMARLIGVDAATSTVAGVRITNFLSSTNTVPGSNVDFSTVTTALSNKLDSATGVLALKQVTGVAASTDTVAMARLIGVDAATSTVAGVRITNFLSSTNTVPGSNVNFSTITAALNGKLDTTGILPLAQVTGVAASTDVVAGARITSFFSSTNTIPGSNVDLSTVAALNSPNTFTAAQTITAIDGLTVTFGVNAGTVTLTGGITASSATLTGDAEVRGGLTVGGGTKLNNILHGSVSVTSPGLIAAQACANTAVAVAGAAAGDKVVWTAPSAIEAGLSWGAYDGGAGNLGLRLCNATAGGITPATATWGYIILR